MSEFDYAYHAALINQEISDFLRPYLDEICAPSVIYKPKIFQDGEQWCALLGDNIQSGVAGFGKTPREAMANFDENFNLAK